MAIDKLKVIVKSYDSSTEEEIQLDNPVLLDWEENEDYDVEIEVVYDTSSNPVVRPKRPPRY